jgi:ribosomal protein L17
VNGVPAVVIEVQVEGRVIAFADAESAADERRLLLELRDRAVLDEVFDALARLYDELASRQEAS